MELDQEKFKAAKVLADIGQAISQGRAVLVQLKEETEAYIAEREEKLLIRIRALLENSKEMLVQVGKNHDELKSYASELSSFADSVNKFYESVRNIHSSLKEAIKNHEKEIGADLEDLADKKLRLQQQKSIIEADREALSRKSRELNKKSIELNDQEQRIQRGFEELKSKKI